MSVPEEAIKSSGLRGEVVRAVYKHGPLSITMLCRVLNGLAAYDSNFCRSVRCGYYMNADERRRYGRVEPPCRVRMKAVRSAVEKLERDGVLESFYVDLPDPKYNKYTRYRLVCLARGVMGRRHVSLEAPYEEIMNYLYNRLSIARAREVIITVDEVAWVTGLSPKTIAALFDAVRGRKLAIGGREWTVFEYQRGKEYVFICLGG